MQIIGAKGISNFFVSGVSYRKTEAAIRSRFSINKKQYSAILNEAPKYGINEFFIVSTCNRTDIYGFADSPPDLVALLCSRTEGSAETFAKISYTKRGKKAIEHLFNVGAGLDSQILGDYEIVGQVKHSAKFAKEYGRIDAFTERLVNCVLQSSKAIKNQTALSSGTVSVSFAAIQYLREHLKEIKNKKIILLGTGKIGRNTCKNLVDYLGTKNITLINRTEEKASALAVELGLQSASLKELPQHLAASDIIIVATDSMSPVILRSQLEGLNHKVIIDLSVPHNVEPAAQQLSNINLINVDDLSRMKDETLAMREAEVQKAKDHLFKGIVNSLAPFL